MKRNMKRCLIITVVKQSSTWIIVFYICCLCAVLPMNICRRNQHSFISNKYARALCSILNAHNTTHTIFMQIMFPCSLEQFGSHHSFVQVKYSTMQNSFWCFFYGFIIHLAWQLAAGGAAQQKAELFEINTYTTHIPLSLSVCVCMYLK